MSTSAHPDKSTPKALANEEGDVSLSDALGLPAPTGDIPDAEWMTTLLEAVDAAKDWKTLHRGCAAFTLAIGYDQFLYGFELPSTDGRYSSFVLYTYPDEWIARYNKRHYVEADPVVARGIIALAPFDWTEIVCTSEASREVIQTAVKFGLAGGFSVPVPPTRGLGGAGGLLNIASSRPLTLTGARRTAVFSAALLLAQRVLIAAMRIADAQRATFFAGRTPLTAAQKNVLQHLATGATEEAIAEKLSVSRSAIKDTLRAILRKMGAGSREEALVRASLFGLVGWSYRPDALNDMMVERKTPDRK